MEQGIIRLCIAFTYKTIQTLLTYLNQNVMLKKVFFILSMAGMLWGCGQREREKLTAQLDSLKSELHYTQEATQTLQEVGVLIDSIDATRQLLRTSMVEGTTYDDYVSRMNDIHSYVKETEKKIKSLEKAAKSSKSTASSYEATIKKLKNDLEKSTREMGALQELVNNYRNENQNLIQTVGLKDAEILEKDELIKVKQQEFTQLETRVQEMMVQSKTDEAESYFQRAQAVEETANRTKFAPKKKKETQKQALELYKMALFLGKQEAQPKVAMLEEKL
jgi:chromosome segregation ATPase